MLSVKLHTTVMKIQWLLLPWTSLYCAVIHPPVFAVGLLVLLSIVLFSPALQVPRLAPRLSPKKKKCGRPENEASMWPSHITPCFHVNKIALFFVLKRSLIKICKVILLELLQPTLVLSLMAELKSYAIMVFNSSLGDSFLIVFELWFVFSLVQPWHLTAVPAPLHWVGGLCTLNSPQWNRRWQWTPCTRLQEELEKGVPCRICLNNLYIALTYTYCNLYTYSNLHIQLLQ